ncbi:LacI family DNA-binding transcriptional regulator [Marinomonas transparens]|uniref:LacI family DNA-binding transcriptional regulator n=1 Tax=Marinomonas transparens TaxID=2795388 RepID=A0A934JSB5_9GAMM|nr:LacI family DNA-binding transcriptional regulator [Marinomonas transparens]MBJ7536187.1 LacI family DNA-binding transcriptional regulator [Marinomonas transparens]
MDKPSVTSADVARLAGVSQSTVSRSFDSSSRISDGTRQKVFAAADELGYQVNKAAQTMIKKRSDLVGLVTAGLADPFRSEFLNSLVLEIQNNGLRPMVIDVSDTHTIDVQLQSLIQYQLSGVIITSGTPSEAVAKTFIKRGTPVVLVNRADHSSEADIVNLDNEKAGALAAEALMKAGKRKLMVVRSKVASYSSVKRTKGFLDKLSPFVKQGSISLEEAFCETGNYHGGAQFGADLLASKHYPDGVFFCMDCIACGFLDALKQSNTLAVPTDIAVIGCDDISIARYQSYDLTTVRQSPQKMAAAAVSALQKRLKQPNTKPIQQKVSVELVFRGTLTESNTL